jgi:predicted permease
MTSLWRRLRYWSDRAKRSDMLREEIELHIAEKAAELEQNGNLSGPEAYAEARRRFGNVGLKQEESREIWMTRFLSEFGQDLRYGWRMFRSNKAFSALAVLSLALGIGANTAIYSFMESILLRSLPVSSPESLVVVNWTSRPPQNANKDWVHVVHGVQGMMWPGNKGMLETGMLPYAAYQLMRDDNPAFSTVFGYFDGRKHNVVLRGQAASARTEFVTGDYFSGLAVSPVAGRLIEPGDDKTGAPTVAVISFSMSEQRFGSPANAIGQRILVDNVPFTIAGVTPPSFFGVDPASSPELYLPMHTTVQLEGPEAARAFQDENFYWIEVMGRLRPGVTLAQAQAALAPRFERWVASTAKTEGELANLPVLKLNPGGAGLGGLRREYAKPLWVLLAMVAMILAITCANIANLLLARAAARHREMAVRLSLGAGRWRVVRQLLTESVLLASLGGTVGIVFAIWGMRSLTLLFAKGDVNFTLHAELNWKVLAATAALSVLCGLLFGLVPALQSTRADVLPALKSSAAGGTSPRRRTQQVLMVAQIAMSFVILFAAGLFVRTLEQLNAVQLGYARDNILLFRLNAEQAGHRDPEIRTFYADLRKRLESIPGVRSASFANSSILSSGMAGGAIRGAMKFGTVTVDGARSMAVGPGFLSTMQIPVLVGRELDERDQPGSAPIAVITERLAKKYFANESPLGRRIRFVEEKREFEIVGVAAELRNGSLKMESSSTVFLPASQVSPGGMTYAIRTAGGDPLAYVRNVHEIVREADASLPVTNIMTQAAEIDRSINREILFARLCTAFALLALLTACVGMYGTMSYSVARQAGEIGLRMALGAPRGRMVWMVLRNVLLLVAAGLAVSIPVALAGSRLVKSLLFGTAPTDPLTIAAAALILLAAAIAAGYIPARRASQVDPLVALRQE